MIPKKQALKLPPWVLLHEDGCVDRAKKYGVDDPRVYKQWRINGKSQSWVDCKDFRIPLKRVSDVNPAELDFLTHNNCARFHLSHDCPLSRKRIAI